MPVVAVVTFVNGEIIDVVVVLGGSRGELGFFFGSVADFVGITDPATLGRVGLAHI